MRSRKRTSLIIALAACALLTPAQLVQAKTLRILAQNVGFGAAPTDARVGDVIEWVNKDFVAHTATARDGSFDVELPPEKTVRVVLKHAGKIQFYCRYHPNMTGEIIVSP